MNKHTLSPSIFYCKHCGYSLEELCNNDSGIECMYPKEIINIRYLIAKKVWRDSIADVLLK